MKRLAVLFLLGSLFLTADVSLAQEKGQQVEAGQVPPGKEQELKPNQKLERAMTGAETHRYRFDLRANVFLQVRVEQKGVDVALKLSDASGNVLATMDSPNSKEGPETLSFVAESAGTYKLEVSGFDAKAEKGIYTIRRAPSRTARLEDRGRVETERLFAEGVTARGVEGQDKTALAKLSVALRGWQELKDSYLIDLTARELKQLEANILFAEARTLANEGTAVSIRASLPKLEAAQNLYQEIGSKRDLAFCLGWLGGSHDSLGEKPKALEYYNRALSLYQDLNIKLGEALMLSKIGSIDRDLGKNQEALEFLGQALTLYRTLGEKPGEATMLNNLGAVYAELGAIQKALEFYNQALTLHQTAGDKNGEETSLHNIGGLYSRLGENKKALELLDQALALSRTLGNKRSEANNLHDIGELYGHTGEGQKALELYDQALILFKVVGDKSGEAVTLKNIGDVYSALGSKQRALEFYNQALLLQRAIGDKHSEGYTLNNIGLVYADLGENQKALEFYNQALPLRRIVGDGLGEAHTLNNIGLVYSTLGKSQEALEFFNQALPLSRAVSSRDTQAAILNNIGGVYLALGKSQKVLEYLNQALQLTRSVGDKADEGTTLANLMKVWTDLGKPGLGIFYGKQAINTFQQLRGNIQGLDKDMQKSYLGTVETRYRYLADLLIAQGRLPEAQQVLGLLKEEEYFEFVRRDGNEAASLKGSAAMTPEEASVEKQYSEIADRVTAIGVEYGQLRDKKTRTSEEEERLGKLESDLTVANQVFQKFLDEIDKAFGDSAAGSDKAFQLRESQGLMETLRELGSGAVALYTVVGEDKYRVILVTPEVQKAYEYPIKAADLNRKVLEFREALQNPRVDPRPPGQELFKILIGPQLAHDLAQAKAQTLMWSLDGVLRYLPVAALHDGHEYLLERYRNVVFTPASQSRLKDAVSAHWKALGLGVSKGQPGFAPLPGVPEELRGIIRAEDNGNTAGAGTGVLAGRVMLDEAFTSSAMQTALRQHFPLVHIASHFQFRPGNETDSFLLLGDGSHLTLAQIKSLPNVFSGVDLLTLSACDTATGGSGANGKEVEGFGVLAQRQGAKAVLATLWPVADESTQKLMREFYRLHETNPQWTKAEALRQAQLALLKGDNRHDGATTTTQRSSQSLSAAASPPGSVPFKPDPNAPYSHPYYWAPFILIGNWK